MEDGVAVNVRKEEKKKRREKVGDRVPINIVAPCRTAPTSNTLITSAISLVHHR